MLSKIKLVVVAGMLLLLAGCIKIPISNLNLPTQAATNAPTPLVIIVTATPFAPVQIVTATPVEAYSTTTPTPANATITITQVEDVGGGRAIVHWASTGNFPGGVQVVWSSSNQSPTYPSDQSSYTGDPAARSAMISGYPGNIYYVRVCRYVNNACDIYSNLGIFAFANITSTPVYYPYNTAIPTHVAPVYNSGGTAIPSSSSITITSMTDGGLNKAIINWSAVGTFSNGFAIVYSTSSTTPYVGGYPYYLVSGGTTKSAYVDGAPGTKVYYRVCRYTGSTCDIYSNTYAYTYPGTLATATPDPAVIGITSISDSGLGSAAVNWNATGSFPGGFKVMYSKSHNPPTLSDSVVNVTNGTLRTATITGDPGAAYHVRVCKYSNGACVVYSTVKDFTFASDPAAISITGFADTTLGHATISWDATGVFPSGFKIAYSKTNATPTLSDSVIVVSNGTLRTANITGDPGVTYHYRICKVYNGSCIAFSAAQNFTFAADSAMLNITDVHDTASGQAGVTWTASGDFGSGFKILYSKTNNPPTLSDTVVTISSSSARSATISGTAGSTYFIRVCKIYGSSCTPSSSVDTFTFGKINLSITSFLDVSSGVATINWTDVGTFPNGFKVLYAAGKTPVYGTDLMVDVPNPDATSATVTGTPGTAYFFRVCEYNGVNGCVLASTNVSFTFAKITLTSLTQPLETSAHLAWTVNGVFPNGFLWLDSFTTAEPTVSDSQTDYGVVGGGSAARSADFTIVPGLTYNFRVCQAASATQCLVYSNVLSHDFASTLVLTGEASGGNVTLNWTGPTGYTNFTDYKIFGGLSTDVSPTELGTVVKTTDTFPLTVGASGNYTYFVCAYDSAITACRGYSNMQVIDITVP